MTNVHNRAENCSTDKAHNEDMFAAGVNQTRPPLKETNGNLPSTALRNSRAVKGMGPPIKSALRNKSNLENVNNKGSGKSGQVAVGQTQEDIKKENKENRLDGAAFEEWQRSWRKLMKQSVVYFDTQGNDAGNTAHQQDQKSAQRALKHIGCNIVPFYDRSVTIIISRRTYEAAADRYVSSDIFHDACVRKIKVWSYEKVFRFLKYLGVNEAIYRGDSDHVSGTKAGDLSNLLKEEKLFGANDRDPNARRDDLYYLEKNFLYVYDLTQKVRPLAIREWRDESYPLLSLTLDGKCPFMSDNSENLERKRSRRLQRFEATRNYRELLKRASDELIYNIKHRIHFDPSDVSGFVPTPNDSDASIHEKDDFRNSVNNRCENSDSMNPSKKARKTSHGDSVSTTKESFKCPPPPAHLIRESSCTQPWANSNSKAFDVAASGYNGASNAAQVSVDSVLNSTAAQGNGLGPTVSQVPSKNINNLKRRIFMKKQKHNIHDDAKDKDLKPGYCENCHVRYNNFQDHINSNRHRNFACDDRNFKDIDKLITTLNESKSFGYVTSNGEFTYAN